MPKMTKCNLPSRGTIDVEDALSFKKMRLAPAYLDFRCLKCNEAVRPHKAGGKAAAHFEHHERNPKCPYSDSKK